MGEHFHVLKGIALVRERVIGVPKLDSVLRQAFRLAASAKAPGHLSLWSRTIASMTISQTKSEANEPPTPASTNPPSPAKRRKLTGRAFYESLGSPKMILAPMVDQSEFVRCFIRLSYHGWH